MLYLIYYHNFICKSCFVTFLLDPLTRRWKVEADREGIRQVRCEQAAEPPMPATEGLRGRWLTRNSYGVANLGHIFSRLSANDTRSTDWQLHFQTRVSFYEYWWLFFLDLLEYNTYFFIPVVH